ncbi:DgyrCDS2953 [Dimorphilus gyrociliatus]|uniref:DgyrCDS2953 n=1 Tax=Dimorphilus gyrociliatus TaxID=2664684 RepID=A0A7I8VBR2_9ANNE|nr:DgyrCDS2953 [Dimorphilus gyrociliatus]
MNLSLILILVLLYISKIICEDVCQTRECLTKCSELGYSLTDSCPTCHCNQRKGCPPVRCVITCKFGRKQDRNGCEYCRCQDPCKEGVHMKNCPEKHYCKADFDCNEIHCKIRTQCIKIGSFPEDLTTSTVHQFRPSFKGVPGRPGPDGPTRQDVTNALPPNPPAPIPSPTKPGISQECKCRNNQKCDCTTIGDEIMKSTFKGHGFYSSDMSPDISTKERHPASPQLTNEDVDKKLQTIHFPTYLYASLASVLGASILGIVILTIVLYRRRYPKEIDIQEEELTKETESATSSEANHKKDMTTAHLATQV